MTHEEGTVRLTGLDGQDPLAFLAALGCLLAASERCRAADIVAPTLSFEMAGVVTPVLRGAFADGDVLLDMLCADLDEIAGRSGPPRDAFLTYSYPDDSGKPVQDLKPPLEHFRKAAQEWIVGCMEQNRRTVDWAAATLTDVAVDRSKGAGKPFALHFTAGNQRFLTVALELLDGGGNKSSERPVDREDLRAALFGPWPNDRALKVFSWSPTQDRAYALRAIDPATDQKLGTPGADWLALRGIGLLSSAPIRTEIRTSGVHGKWKTATFSYPIWPSPLDVDVVRALLRHPGILPHGEDRPTGGTAARTLPRGVEVLTSRISRSDQGGYGSFSRPSRR